MTTVAPPQQRPLVLLHKCTECATFAIAPSAITEKKTMDIDRIRLRFSQVLGLSHNRPTPKKDVEDGDDDSAYGSSNSGQSSPDESPVSRSDSPSPIDQKHGAAKIDDAVHLPDRPQNPFRYRSVSESGESPPVKGILKRRGPVLRSLSQCEEKVSSIPRNASSESQSFDSSNDDGLNYSISESGEDEDSGRERSQSNSSTSVKKSVRFDDRVQENLFRPNSSILGQRKKNQRKQQRKRKRTSSGDSQTGESEYENDQEAEMDDGDGTAEPPQEKMEVQEPKPVAKPSTNPKPSSRKKVQRQGPLVLEDKRYTGFVLGAEQKPRPLNHRRHSSGDSGLGDDEEEGEVFASPLPKGGNKNRRRTVSCGDGGME